FVSGREGGLPDVRHVFRTLREGKPARLRGLREASALFRPQERQANRLPAAAMAVARAKIPSAGSAQSSLLGTAMFAPSVLFIALLIGVPFVLAVLYAFSDARIGATSFHYVGLENFRSILASPSFRKALRNSIVFTLVAQAIVIVCSNILAIALEKPFRGRGLVRFLILLPWVAPVSL